MADKETQELPEQLTLTLRKPITLGGDTIETLELREPNAAEYKKFTKQASSDPVGAMVALIAMVSGVAPPIIDRIGVRDMNAAGEYLMAFMGPSQPTEKS
jgi:hypothetical protein